MGLHCSHPRAPSGQLPCAAGGQHQGRMGECARVGGRASAGIGGASLCTGPATLAVGDMRRCESCGRRGGPRARSRLSLGRILAWGTSATVRPHADRIWTRIRLAWREQEHWSHRHGAPRWIRRALILRRRSDSIRGTTCTLCSHFRLPTNDSSRLQVLESSGGWR